MEINYIWNICCSFNQDHYHVSLLLGGKNN